MSESDVGTSLVQTLCESDLSDLSTNLSEMAVDQLLDADFAQDMPIFGALSRLKRLGTDISGYLFTRKLLLFFGGLSDVPCETRQQMVSQLAVDVRRRKEVGETLLLLLDRMNNMQKPVMMARAFRAYIEKRIDWKQFQQLSRCIDAVDVSCLDELKRAYGVSGDIGAPIRYVENTDFVPQHLATCGLLAFDFGGKPDPATSTKGRINFRSGGFKTNDLGALFFREVLEGGRPHSDALNPET